MRRYRLASVIAAGLASASLAAPAKADVCTRAIVRVSAESGVPIRLLWAIANVESRMAGKPSPYAVNDAEGRPHYFRSAAAAHDFVARAIRAGDRNLDIGCMQLNWRWHGQNLPSIAHAFDPYTNVKYAAGYLADLRRETGSWSNAVAFYHSRQRGRGEAYQCRVVAALTSKGADGC